MRKLNGKASKDFGAPQHEQFPRLPYRAKVIKGRLIEPQIFPDPTPTPYGCPWGVGRIGESPEQRAFRRFPIDSHKPGGW